MDKLKTFKNLRPPIKLSGSVKKKEPDRVEEDSFYNPGMYNLEEEYKRYNQMIQEGIEDKSLFFRIGRINHFWGNIEVAKQYYRKALSIDRDDGECHYNLGNIFFKCGELKEARKEFLLAVEANSRDVYTLNAMGKTCFRLKDFEEAEKYHNMALDVNSDDVYALRGLGDICLARKDYDEAMNCYQSALEVNPHDNLTLHNKGLVYILKGEIKKAENHYLECLVKNEKFPGYYIGLAFSYIKQKGRKEEAVNNYKKAMGLIKEYPAYGSLAEYDEISDLGIDELKEMKNKIFGKDISLEPMDSIKVKREVGKRTAESVSAFMAVDLVSLEVGRGLLSFVDRNQGAKLLDRVTSIRRHLAMEMGIIVPGIRFRDNQQLKPDFYVIKIKDVEVASGEIMINRYLAIAPEGRLDKLEGPRCLDPTYGMPSVWITPEQRVEADRLGAMIFDPLTVMATQITEVIRCNADALITRQETLSFLERLKKTHPIVIKEIYPEVFSLGEIQLVLQNLLRERVSIRDLVTILETMANYSKVTRDADRLTEYVRQALSRVICRQYQNKDGVITVIKLAPELEKYIINSACSNEAAHKSLSVNEEMVLELIEKEVNGLVEKAIEPIILCSPFIRLYLRKITEGLSSEVVVLSYKEIFSGVKVNTVATIKLPSQKIISEKNSITGKRNMFLYIEKLLSDEDPRVRAEAVKSLIPLANVCNLNSVFDYIDKSLEDSSEMVRLEGARVMRELIERYSLN